MPTSKSTPMPTSTSTPQYYYKKINYQNINYNIPSLKLVPSASLNISNLFKSPIHKDNIIQNPNTGMELGNENLSYLISYYNQKYLINKVGNSIILTNLFNKNSQVLKNKDIFKIGNFDFCISNDSTFLMPMINKKIFDNNNSTNFNMWIPRV